MELINPNYPDYIKDISIRSDRRNVIDHYKSMSEELIKGSLAKVRSDLVVIAENYASDFNLASTIRNLNAFTGKEIWIVGDRRFDRRGTVGTHNYETINYSNDISSVLDKLRSDGYTIVAVDNVEAAQNIEIYSWDHRTAIILGQEKIGVSNESLNAADDIVFIPMRGSTRSLNVAVASGIVMYDYSNKLGVTNE